jgi:hypothetical protein
MSSSADTEIANYIAQLNPLEQKVLHIAREHLETSFSLRKSIGFQEWQAKAPAEQAPAHKVQVEQQVQEPSEPPPVVIKRKIRIKHL